MRRILSLVLAAALLVPVLALTLASEAQALTYVGSASYRAGKFYERLIAVELTGDQRTDIVNVARSQIGYQEGNSTNQLGGEVFGSTNFTEYGQWYGAQDMWCAMFVSWCANLAGVSDSVIPVHAYTPNGLQFFRDRDRAFPAEQVISGEYTPQPGDLIYFKNGRNANRTNHVGLVTGYSDGTIYTIEGNVGSAAHTTNDGMVTEKSYPITNEFIVAICSPKYPVSGTSTEAALPEPEPLFQSVQKEPEVIEEPEAIEEPSVTQEQKDALRQAIYTLESGGRYDRVTDAYGAITLGAGQWYGDEAQDLLLEIQAADPEGFAALDTAGIAQDLLLESWNGYRAEPEKAACIQTILGSEAGIACQDARMNVRIEECLAQAEALEITVPEAAVLCAGLLHLTNAETVEALLEQSGGELAPEALLSTGNTDPICGLLSRCLEA